MCRDGVARAPVPDPPERSGIVVQPLRTFLGPAERRPGCGGSKEYRDDAFLTPAHDRSTHRGLAVLLRRSVRTPARSGPDCGGPPSPQGVARPIAPLAAG